MMFLLIVLLLMMLALPSDDWLGGKGAVKVSSQSLVTWVLALCLLAMMAAYQVGRDSALRHNAMDAAVAAPNNQNFNNPFSGEVR